MPPADFLWIILLAIIILLCSIFIIYDTCLVYDAVVCGHQPGKLKTKMVCYAPTNVGVFSWGILLVICTDV